MVISCDTSNPCGQAHIIDLTYNLTYTPDILVSCMLGDLIWLPRTDSTVFQVYSKTPIWNINKHTCHHLPHACLAPVWILPVCPNCLGDRLKSFRETTAQLYASSAIT